jgi:hypothetical protein
MEQDGKEIGGCKIRQAGAGNVKLRQRRWKEENSNKMETKTSSGEKWRLLGCYAVWLL